MTDRQAKELTLDHLFNMVPSGFVRMLQQMLQEHRAVIVAIDDGEDGTGMLERCRISQETWDKPTITMMWQYAIQREPGITPYVAAI